MQLGKPRIQSCCAYLFPEWIYNITESNSVILFCLILFETTCFNLIDKKSVNSLFQITQLELFWENEIKSEAIELDD